MPAVQIQIRLGSKSKMFTSRAANVAIGRSPSSELVLPFPWIEECHVIIENGEALRVKLGSEGAQARLSGTPLTMEWQAMASPSRIAIPAPNGFSLLLDVATVEPSMNMMVLSSNATANGDDAAGTETLSMSRFQGAETPPEDAAPEEAANMGSWQVPSLQDAEGFTPNQRLSLIIVSCVMVLLVLGSLGINRVRHKLARDEFQTQWTAVDERIRRAENLIQRKDYTGAKAALDAADELAAQRKEKEFVDQRTAIAAMRERPEIRLGSRGLVEMDGQWLPAATVSAWRVARERDDPKIRELEQKATIALASKQYDDAKAACEQALAIIDTHPVKQHPRAAPLRALLTTVRTQAVAAEMTAKGLVEYRDRWVTPEEKARLENQAKGLVEYQGEWMTREEALAAEKRGGTGKVFFNGKWMTPDQKMEAQGYVKFEGQWVRPEERDAVLAKRQEEKDRAAATTRAAEDKRIAEEKAEKLKSVAYAKSQEFVKSKFTRYADAKFATFGTDKVQVVFDEGWYIVRSIVTPSNGSVSVGRTYYCKLRPTTGDSWEAETVIVSE